jgi:hypothetical protein
MKIIDYIDQSHLLEHVKKIPASLITEIIIIIFCINLIFSIIYFQIYRNNKNSFKNIHHIDTNSSISYYDFVYYSNTLFYSLGYDIAPNSNITKTLSMIHLNLGFIVTTIYISKIISSWN